MIDRPARGFGPRFAWFPLLLLALGELVLSGGCSWLYTSQRPQNTERLCARRLVAQAWVQRQQARDHLVTYYENRQEPSLYDAYQSSQEALTLARRASTCTDFGVVRDQALALYRSMRHMQRLIYLNLRDDDPGLLRGILEERYAEAFPLDIDPPNDVEP